MMNSCKNLGLLSRKDVSYYSVGMTVPHPMPFFEHVHQFHMPGR